MPERPTVIADFEIVDETKRPRKWEAGEPLKSLEEIDAAMTEGRMLWLLNRPQHARWVGNLNYGMLKYYLRAGKIRDARVTLEYIRWLERELETCTPLLPF